MALGATPGILMVLHTWTGQILYHPHVHLLVTGGGVSHDGVRDRIGGLCSGPKYEGRCGQARRTEGT